MLIESGRLDDAVMTLDQYLTKSPDDAEGFIALGEIAAKSNRWTDAWLNLNRADELISENKIKSSRLVYVLPGLIELRAEVAERRQQWDDAEGLFTHLAELRLEVSYPLWRLGRVKLLRGNVKEGIEEMQKARKRDPKLPSAELTAATFLAEHSQLDDAEKWFKAAIISDKTSVSYWHAYLKWLLLSERIDELNAALRKLGPAVASHRDIQMLSGFHSVRSASQINHRKSLIG